MERHDGLVIQVSAAHARSLCLIVPYGASIASLRKREHGAAFCTAPPCKKPLGALFSGAGLFFRPPVSRQPLHKDPLIRQTGVPGPCAAKSGVRSPAPGGRG